MRVQGKIIKELDGSGFSIILDEVGAYTQGETRDEALANAKEAIALALDGCAGTQVNAEDIEIYPIDNQTFEFGTNKIKALVACVLVTAISDSKISYAELARRLNSKNQNSARQYAKGERLPSVEKFDQMLEALGVDLRISFTPKIKKRA